MPKLALNNRVFKEDSRYKVFYMHQQPRRKKLVQSFPTAKEALVSAEQHKDLEPTHVWDSVTNEIVWRFF
jgi:hypothetical protein